MVDNLSHRLIDGCVLLCAAQFVVHALVFAERKLRIVADFDFDAVVARLQNEFYIQACMFLQVEVVADIVERVFFEVFHARFVVDIVEQIEIFFAEVNTLGVGFFGICNQLVETVFEIRAHMLLPKLR